MNIRRSLVYSLAQRYVAFGISFIAMMALARLLTPAEIGVYSVGAAFVGLAQILRDLGVGRYIVQERDLTDAHVRGTLGVGLILGILIAAVLGIGAGAVADFYHAPELADVLRILALSFLLIPFTTPAMAVLTRELAFNLTFRVGILQVCAHSATGVAMAYAGFGPLSLAWASFAGVAASLAALLALRPRIVLQRPSLQHWRRIVSFGGQSSLASAMGHLGAQAPDLILGRLLGFQAVGLYSRAQGLIQVFEQQFMRSITGVAFPAYARTHREGHSLKPDYLRGACYVTAFAWPFFGTLFLIAEPLIAMVFGDQWRPSAPLAQTLCISGAITAMWSLAPHLMIGVGRIAVFVRLLAITESSRVLLIAAAALATRSIGAVAWVQLPVSLLAFAVTTIILAKLVDVHLLDILRAVRLSSLVGLAVLLCAGAARGLLEGADDFFVVAATGSAAMVGWVLALLVTRHPVSVEIVNLVSIVRAQLSTRFFGRFQSGTKE
jgi:O-antigen/teichoic acid export membrane protein